MGEQNIPNLFFIMHLHPVMVVGLEVFKIQHFGALLENDLFLSMEVSHTKEATVELWN